MYVRYPPLLFRISYLSHCKLHVVIAAHRVDITTFLTEVVDAPMKEGKARCCACRCISCWVSGLNSGLAFTGCVDMAQHGCSP
jgi:hypothetical protein